MLKMGLLSKLRRKIQPFIPPVNVTQQQASFQYPPGILPNTYENILPPPIYNQVFHTTPQPIYNSADSNLFYSQQKNRDSVHSFHSHYKYSMPQNDSRRGSIHSSHSILTAPFPVYVRADENFYDLDRKVKPTVPYKPSRSASDHEFSRSNSTRSIGKRQRKYERDEDNVNVRGEVIYDSGYINL